MAILNLSKIQHGLTTKTVGSEIISFEETGSTNELIKHYLNEKEGLTLLAERQTKGRGRFGRSWDSKKSLGIYVSVLLKPFIVFLMLLHD